MLSRTKRHKTNRRFDQILLRFSLSPSLSLWFAMLQFDFIHSSSSRFHLIAASTKCVHSSFCSLNCCVVVVVLFRWLVRNVLILFCVDIMIITCIIITCNIISLFSLLFLHFMILFKVCTIGLADYVCIVIIIFTSLTFILSLQHFVHSSFSFPFILESFLFVNERSGDTDYNTKWLMQYAQRTA